MHTDGAKLDIMGNFMNIWVCESIFKRFAPAVNLLLRFTSSTHVWHGRPLNGHNADTMSIQDKPLGGIKTI